MNIKRLRQIRLFIAGSIVLIFLHLWANNYYSSAEKLLNDYSNANHMGSLEEFLLQEDYKDGTILLGKAENGLVYLSVKENIGYSKEYEIYSNDGWAFSENGVVVKHIDPLEKVYGYAEIEDIAKIVCWMGNDSRICEKITLYPDDNGLFLEAEQETEVIMLSESGTIWQPGGSRGWHSNVHHIYAVEGLDLNGEPIYWYSDYDFIKDDFDKPGYQLLKKIFDRVVDSE